jgi:O-6-methylguanine DNA methyltransferase
VAATERGVVRIGFARASRDYAAWLARYLGDHSRTTSLPALEQLREELADYFERRLITRFRVPLDLLGTPFQCAVWQALRDIPYGETWTYGELAQRLGRPRAVRAVGSANGANPVPIMVPCHRVVAAGSKLGGYSGGLDIKRRLLALESDLQLRASGARPAAPETRPARRDPGRRPER